MGITDNGKCVGWRGGTLSRRGFIQSVAAGGTAMALAGGVGFFESEALASPSGQVAPEEHEFVGACRGNCASSCTIKATVRDGKIVKTEAYETDNPLDRRMCVKGHTWPQRIYLPERLKYPMRRAEGTKRGEGQWEQITWDEAINEIATKWLGYVDEYGPTSVAQVRGDGNLGMANTFYKVLFGTMGAAEVHFSCDHSVTHFAGPKITGYDPWFFGNDPKTMTLSDNVFIWGANIFDIFTGEQEWREVFDQMEYIALVDVVMTETAKYADLVLPAAEYFERWDLSYTVNPYMAINEKAIDPPYECKDDFEIANLLAKALGHEEIVTTIDDFMSEKLSTPLCKKAGVTWEKLKELKTVYTAVDGYYLGVSKPYLSPTGKLNLYFEKIQPLNDYGQVASGELDQKKYSMVTFEPMDEAWNESLGGYPQSEHSKTYPINLMSWRSRFRTHTMFSTVPALLEMQEDPCIYMNPEDMDERGIAEGDKVRAYNERGYVIIRAAKHPGVRKKTAMVEHGWQKHQYIEGSYQSLIGAHSHPLTNQEAWFDVTIEIEKA